MSLSSLKIGSVQLDGNVILAPITGVSDRPFRSLVKQHGASLVMSEMIASQAMIRETRQKLRWYWQMDENFQQIS